MMKNLNPPCQGGDEKELLVYSRLCSNPRITVTCSGLHLKKALSGKMLAFFWLVPNTVTIEIINPRRKIN